jgi:hypothetical protein
MRVKNNKYFLRLNTFAFMVVLFWSWPYRLIENTRKNFYFFELEKIITEGGRAKLYKSNSWWGYHVAWVKDGIEYHYDMSKADKKNLPWWAIPVYYKGKVRTKKQKQ